MLLIDVFSAIKFCCEEDKNESLAVVSDYIHGHQTTGDPEGQLLKTLVNTHGRALYYLDERNPEEQGGDYLSVCTSKAKGIVDKLLITAINYERSD